MPKGPNNNSSDQRNLKPISPAQTPGLGEFPLGPMTSSDPFPHPRPLSSPFPLDDARTRRNPAGARNPSSQIRAPEPSIPPVPGCDSSPVAVGLGLHRSSTASASAAAPGVAAHEDAPRFGGFPVPEAFPRAVPWCSEPGSAAIWEGKSMDTAIQPW
jgi:hypothetical protein